LGFLGSGMELGLVGCQVWKNCILNARMVVCLVRRASRKGNKEEKRQAGLARKDEKMVFLPKAQGNHCGGVAKRKDRQFLGPAELSDDLWTSNGGSRFYYLSESHLSSVFAFFLLRFHALLSLFPFFPSSFHKGVS